MKANEKLKLYLNEKRITHRKAEELTGVKYNHIGRILSGKHTPSLETFLKLCKGVGIEIKMNDEVVE